MLRLSVDPVRLEWTLNYRRFQSTLSRREREHLAIGTTANEALRREINSKFDYVHEMRQSVLRLKLRAFCLYKLLPHTRAMYGRSVRQSSQRVTLARALPHVVVWSEVARRTWCTELRTPSGIQKPDLPLAQRRAEEALAPKK